MARSQDSHTMPSACHAEALKAGWLGTQSASGWGRHFHSLQCAALMAGICLPLGLCKGTASYLWRYVGNVHQSHKPTIHCNWSNPNLYLHQPIIKGWSQQIGSHVSYPIDGYDAYRLGPCRSLWLRLSTVSQCTHIGHKDKARWWWSSLGISIEAKLYWSFQFI